MVYLWYLNLLPQFGREISWSAFANDFAAEQFFNLSEHLTISYIIHKDHHAMGDRTSYTLKCLGLGIMYFTCGLIIELLPYAIVSFAHRPFTFKTMFLPPYHQTDETIRCYNLAISLLAYLASISPIVILHLIYLHLEVNLYF